MKKKTHLGPKRRQKRRLGPFFVFVGLRWLLWAFVDLRWPSLAVVGCCGPSWAVVITIKLKFCTLKKRHTSYGPNDAVWRRLGLFFPCRPSKPSSMI